MSAGPRLLLVDDHADLAVLLSIRLSAAGYQVCSAGSAEEALTRVRGGEPWDLAVLDIDLPGMDGFELLDALRELQPELPAVFLTGRTSLADITRVQAVRAGYLAKPFRNAELLAHIAGRLG